MGRMRNLDEITGAVIDASIELHRTFGPGLFESVYEAVLAHSLTQRGFHVERQKLIRLVVDDVIFEEAFRLDLLINESVIIELKSVEKLAAVHRKQLLTYLRLTDLRVGLLINFGESVLKDGIHRIVNKYPVTADSKLQINRTIG